MSIKSYVPKPALKSLAEISLSMQSGKREYLPEHTMDNDGFVVDDQQPSSSKSASTDLTALQVQPSPQQQEVEVLDFEAPPEVLVDSEELIPMPQDFFENPAQEEQIPKLINTNQNCVLKIIGNDVPIQASNQLVFSNTNQVVAVESKNDEPNVTTTKETQFACDENKENQVMTLTQGQNSNIQDELLLTFQREQQLALMRGQKELEDKKLDMKRLEMFEKFMASRK